MRTTKATTCWQPVSCCCLRCRAAPAHPHCAVNVRVLLPGAAWIWLLHSATHHGQARAITRWLHAGMPRSAVHAAFGCAWLPPARHKCRAMSVRTRRHAPPLKHELLHKLE
jgi:hypothetical protein